jgi:hypothetical protein
VPEPLDLLDRCDIASAHRKWTSVEERSRQPSARGRPMVCAVHLFGAPPQRDIARLRETLQG